MEDNFKDLVIEEAQHDKFLNDQFLEILKTQENTILKLIVDLEKYCDLQDKFKNTTNYKTNIPTIQYEFVNLGSESNPLNINLGTRCTTAERASLIQLFQEYKDIFSQMYDDLKTFGTKIMQHVIPLK